MSDSVIGEEISGTVADAVAKAVDPEEEEEDEEPTYDIYLRESARIMADWIETLDKPATATVANQH
jgi:hypothetical protein